MIAKWKCLWLSCVLAIPAGAGVAFGGATLAPAVELALVVDVSGSVDDAEFVLQRDGYVQAFRSAEVKNALASLAPRGLRVTLIYFDDTSRVAIPFTHLFNRADADAFADAIAAAARPEPGPLGGLTGISTAIRTATGFFRFDSDVQLIDVSGDGVENVTSDAEVQAARDEALAAGIDRINGLAILADDPNLNTYYNDNVIGGQDAFSIPVSTFDDFSMAVVNKISIEVGGGNSVFAEGNTYEIGIFSSVSGHLSAMLSFSNIDDGDRFGHFHYLGSDRSPGVGIYAAGRSAMMISAAGVGESYLGIFGARGFTIGRTNYIFGNGLGSAGDVFVFFGKGTKQHR